MGSSLELGMTLHSKYRLAFPQHYIVVVVVLIAGENPMECENPARASTRQGAHGSPSDVSLIQHQGHLSLLGWIPRMF